MTVTSTPVWHDIFRRVTLKPDNITLEAETYEDTLNIVRGPGVSWGANPTTDTFSILVDYNLTIPASTTKISLEDINGNLSEIELSAGRGVAINRISPQELQIESFSVTETDTLHSVTSRNNITTNTIFVDNIEVGTIASDTAEDGFLSFDPGHNLIGDGTLGNTLRFSPLYQDSLAANNTDQFEFTASGPGTLAYAANYVADTAITTGSVTLEREDPLNPGNWTVLDIQTGNSAGTAYFIDGIYNEAYSGTVTYRLTYAWTGNTGTVTWYTNNTFEAGSYSPIDNPQIKTDTTAKTVDINDIQIFQNTIRTLNSNTDVVFDLAGTGQVRVLGNITSDNFYGNVTGDVLGNLTGNVTGDVSGNAGTVTNGVYTTGSYYNPSWITGLDAAKIIGSIDLSDITVDGSIRIYDNVIETVISNANLELRANGTGVVSITDGLTVSNTLTANSTVSMSPANSNITMSPTGTGTVTINPATAGSIDNMSIGVSTRAAGNFTTLDANSTVGLSPANAAVTISPTGTGNVTINPATAGTINNMSIGVTTRAAGNFTTLDANNAVGLSPVNQNVTISPTGTGTVTINPATAGTINNMSIGVTTRAAGNFTTLDADSNVTLGSDSADIITINGTLANATQFRAGTTAGNTFTFAGYDTNTGPAWVNLLTITSGIAPTIAITSNGVGSIDNINIGGSTPAAGAFTTLSVGSTLSLRQTRELVNILTAPTAAVTIDVLSGAVYYYTNNSTTNWTINFRGNSGTTMDSFLSVGQSTTIAVYVTNSSPAFYNTQVQIDGITVGVTTEWLGGSAPSSGNANSVDLYSYNIIKTAAATYTVFAALIRYA